METIGDFVERFVRGEYELSVSFYSERDDQRFEKRRKEMLALFLPGTADTLMNHFFRTEADDAWIEKGRETLKPRSVFRVEELQSPKLGRIYCCQLGADYVRSNEAPSYHFYVAEYEGDLRIAAHFHICAFCLGAGRLREQRCPECFYGLRVRDQLGGMRKHYPPAAVQLYDEVLKLVQKRLKNAYANAVPKT